MDSRFGTKLILFFFNTLRTLGWSITEYATTLMTITDGGEQLQLTEKSIQFCTLWGNCIVYRGYTPKEDKKTI